ncbi:MAG: phosphatase PAP2 family protein [Eubacterium sp.]|nr:phosphatase PAP2 family protein [Eubacterium sp.]
MRESKDYDIFYKKITSNIREKENVGHTLFLLNKAVEFIMYFSYIMVLINVFFYERGTLNPIKKLWDSGNLKSSILTVAPFVIIPGTGFVLLTIIRKVINRKRPYETWNLDQLIKKDKKGQSMPSRHVYSAAVIAMCVLCINTVLGIICIVIAILLAVLRVVGGVHYPSDVIVGFISGIMTGLLLFIK